MYDNNRALINTDTILLNTDIILLNTDTKSVSVFPNKFSDT
jgi:hypothetical protein